MTWPRACALCLVRYSENHQDSNRVDSASINTLVSKNNPCMFIKVEIFYLPSLDFLADLDHFCSNEIL